MEEDWRCHNDCITYFNSKMYANILTHANVHSKKKSIPYGSGKVYGYYLEKNNETYFAADGYIKSLPFRILDKIEMDYKSDVFTFIKDIEPITIPAENRMTLKHLVDNMANFPHSKPLHYLLNKICSITAYIDRTNYRVSTDAGFGKDSEANIIAGLVNSTANIYGSTFANLEFNLTKHFIILNELGNLKPDDKFMMQEFLLATGGYFNVYNKRTRKTKDTQEEYDISKTSIVIFYNLPSYYKDRAQQYFDQIFTPAVINRFIPFVFEGRLTAAFETVLDVKKIVDKNEQFYKDLIATLTYLKHNNLTEIKYKVDKSLVFSDKLKRYERSFNVILKYVAEYSKDQDEFDELSKELYKCYRKYETLIYEKK